MKNLLYEEKLRLAKEAFESGSYDKETIEYIFPELKESEDERIRKVLIDFFNKGAENEQQTNGIFDKDIIAWLEKQELVEEIVERCKDSWYNEGKIQGMREGLSDEEKYQQGWHDALEKQGEQNHAWNNGYSNGYIHAVEKAVEWLDNHNDYIDVKDGNVTYFDMGKCVEDFSKYMRGGEE